jgi:hypothetical protein
MEDNFIYFEDMRQIPVQPKSCRTCPFGGSDPIKLSVSSYQQYITNLVEGTGQHLCHSAENRVVCRGGREIQLKVLTARGFIPEPTDAAFSEAIEKYVQ